MTSIAPPPPSDANFVPSVRQSTIPSIATNSSSQSSTEQTASATIPMSNSKELVPLSLEQRQALSGITVANNVYKKNPIPDSLFVPTTHSKEEISQLIGSLKFDETMAPEHQAVLKEQFAQLASDADGYKLVASLAEKKTNITTKSLDPAHASGGGSYYGTEANTLFINEEIIKPLTKLEENLGKKEKALFHLNTVIAHEATHAFIATHGNIAKKNTLSNENAAELNAVRIALGVTSQHDINLPVTELLRSSSWLLNANTAKTHTEGYITDFTTNNVDPYAPDNSYQVLKDAGFSAFQSSTNEAYQQAVKKKGFSAGLETLQTLLNQ